MRPSVAGTAVETAAPWDAAGAVPDAAADAAGRLPAAHGADSRWPAALGHALSRLLLLGVIALVLVAPWLPSVLAKSANLAAVMRCFVKHIPIFFENAFDFFQ